MVSVLRFFSDVLMVGVCPFEFFVRIVFFFLQKSSLHGALCIKSRSLLTGRAFKLIDSEKAIIYWRVAPILRKCVLLVYLLFATQSRHKFTHVVHKNQKTFFRLHQRARDFCRFPRARKEICVDFC